MINASPPGRTAGPSPAGSVGSRALARATCLIASLGMAAMLVEPAAAAEFEWGEVTALIDTTVSVGASLRTEDPATDNFCTAIGGSSGDCGATEGNLNYAQGRLTSTNIQATHEVDVRWRNLGLFGRVNYFYDSENHDGSRRFKELPSRSRKESGADWELLDGYLSGYFTPYEMPLSVKIGEQVINWGESTFIPNGLNVINPIDVSRLRSPGAEVREALLPIPAFYANLGVSENFSIEGFWQWGWRETRLDSVGTFFSTSDGAGPGGRFFDISLGHNDCSINPLFFGVRQDGTVGPSCITRGPTRDPKDRNQWGFAARFFIPWLNGAELGLYVINYHSRLPYVGGNFRENAAQAGASLAAMGMPTDGLSVAQRVFSQVQLQQEYPEDIRKYGISYSSTIETLDIAVQGELSWSKDFPLQLSSQQTVRALVGGAGLPQAVDPLPGTPQVAPGQFLRGGFDHRVYTGQVTFTKLIEPGPIVGGVLGASQATLVSEVGFVRVRGLESTNRITFQGAVTPSSVAEGASADLDADFGQKFSWGYVAVAALQYNNAFLGWNLSPSVAFRHDVNGTSPSPIGNFVEDRLGVTLSVRGDYLNKWGVALSYASFFGAGQENTIRDRDFVSLSLSYSF